MLMNSRAKICYFWEDQAYYCDMSHDDENMQACDFLREISDNVTVSEPHDFNSSAGFWCGPHKDSHNRSSECLGRFSVIKLIILILICPSLRLIEEMR